MVGAIRFLLNDQPRTLDRVDPNTTVLEYLRERERLTGTKEGCAEGDCGACTVVVAERLGERLSYRAVNSCIQFLPTLDGKQLITVEGLAGPDGALHPAQQALVDCHGSQCGFCTPGFVMSLYAHYMSGANGERRVINDALAGNLCRCTGYRPIVEAASRMRSLPAPVDAAEREAGALAALAALAALGREGDLDYKAGAHRFVAPRSRRALVRVMAEHPDATVLAGGTDAGLWATKELRSLPLLVYVGEVPELKILERSESHLEIGAALSYSDAMDAIGELYPSIGELIRRLGSVQIRNAGTIGGNIANASPIGDMPPALIALGASVVLIGPSGSREVALDDFFVDYRKVAMRPGEVIERVRLPLPRPELFFRAYKISKRFDQDISGICGAFAIRLADKRIGEARIAFGGMAAVPKRARNAEAALLNRPFTAETVTQAQAALADDFEPLDDMRASRAYRERAARNLLYKTFVEMTWPDVSAHVLSVEA